MTFVTEELPDVVLRFDDEHTTPEDKDVSNLRGCALYAQ